MCEFTFQAEESEQYRSPSDFESLHTRQVYEIDRRPPLSEWSCPHPSHEEFRYCIFHLDENTRKKEGISSDKIREEFVNCLLKEGRESEFIGATLPELEIHYDLISTEAEYIDLRCSQIEKLDFTGTEIKSPLFLDQSKIGEIDLSRSTITEELSLAGTDINGHFSCRGAKLARFIFSSGVVEDGCDFTDALFTNEVNFQYRDFKTGSGFHRTSFKEEVNFSHAKFPKYNENEFVDPQFDQTEFKDDAMFSYSRLHSAMFSGIECDEQLNLFSAEIDTISISGEIKELFIGLPDTAVEVGQISLSSIESDSIKIEQPLLEENVYYSITNSDIQKLSYDARDSENPMKYIQFVDSRIGYFDFDDYVDSLTSLDWTIHKNRFPEEIIEKREYLGDNPNIDEPDEALVDDNLTFNEDVRTYRNLRKTATRTGDSIAAGRFLLKEQHFQKYKHRHEVLSGLSFSLPSIQGVQSLRQGWGQNFSQYLIHVFLDHSCGYGEQLWKVGLWSGLVIIGSSLLYPLVGGIGNSQNGLEYTLSNAIYTDSLSIVELITTTLYFSVVSFSTLGYGDFQPMSTATQFLAALESLAGAILVALLIYGLGKRSAR